MQRILVGVDGSEGSDRATHVAAKLANALGAELVVLTVTGHVHADEIRQPGRAEGGVDEALDPVSSAILDEACACARRAGATAVNKEAAWGQAARCIVDAAIRHQADLIVVGRHGQARLAGLLLGSVAHKLVTLAPCPVMVVP